jgi:hypothetical protein
MKTTALAVCLGAAIFTSGCGQDSSADKRVAELERQVTALQAQNRDTRAKLRAFHAFPTRSPLADFFASPEFWQCTYDSSWADCSNRCSTQTAQAHQACFNKPESERVACFEEAAANGSNCLKNCPVQSSPTTPPVCY